MKFKIGNELNYYDYLLYGNSFTITTKEYSKLLKIINQKECDIDDSIRGLISSNFLYIKGYVLFYNYNIIYNNRIPNDNRRDNEKKTEILELIKDQLKLKEVIWLSKLNNLIIVDDNTGEILENGIEVIESIQKEEYKNEYKEIYYKLENNPDDLTYEELEFIKKSDKVFLESLSSNYIRVSKIRKDILLSLDHEILGIVTYLSLLANRDGVLRYRNGIMIKSFNKLRELLSITPYKWNIIKKKLIENEIIATGKLNSNKFLVINPLYSNSHNEIDTYKFIAFHKSLKKHLKPVDYWYLVKKLELAL